MSDPQTPTPEQPKPETPAPQRDDAYAAALRALQADNAGLASEIKARDGKLAEATRELANLRAQVEGYTRKEREGAIVERVRGALPHLSAFEIRGALAALADEGFDRYSDKPDDAATAALELIKSKAPALSRPPAQGGGPSGAPPQPRGRAFKSLVG